MFNSILPLLLSLFLTLESMIIEKLCHEKYTTNHARAQQPARPLRSMPPLRRCCGYGLKTQQKQI